MGVGNALLVFIFIVSFFFFVLLMLAIMPNYGFFIFIVFYFIFCLIDSVLLYRSQQSLYLCRDDFILADLRLCSMCSLL